MGELDKLLAALAKKSGLPFSEVVKRIEEKKESLGYLINDDVAVRLVSKDLGVQTYENSSAKPSVKIADLVPNMNNVNLSFTVENVGVVKEFSKKDGTAGKVSKIIVNDETGKATVVIWDDKTECLDKIMPGIKISVFTAYTKEGMGGLEVHMGSRSRLEVMEAAPSPLANGAKPSKGRIWVAYDPISFKHKDGKMGRVVSFILKNNEAMSKVLVWNPSDDLILRLIDGVAVEISGGKIKAGMNGSPELHISDENSIKVDSSDVSPPNKEVSRLTNIQPDKSNLIIEGIVEGDFDVTTTYSGKTYAKIILREGETALPVVFWNEKALAIKRMAKPGALLRVEGCYTKIGPRGLEIGVNNWSKIRVD